MPLKIKVIFCTDGIFPFQVGGMQRHSRLLIEHLAATQEAELVVIHPHAETVFEKGLGIKEEYIPGIDPSKLYLKECYRYSKRVMDVLSRYPDHLIYSQGLSVWYRIQDVASRLIINPHGLEAYQCLSVKDKLTAIPFKIIFNHLFKHAATVISLGGRLTGILRQHIPDSKKIVVLANAVSLPTLQPPVKNERLHVLFIGRFAPNKGIHVLLKAIEELNAEGYEQHITYQLGGKGPLYDAYKKKYPYQNVRYLGFVSDDQLADLYRTNDLFVLPTLFEGMPTVVLEAMSYAMPIVVTDVGATAELVSEQNGFLIKKNDVADLKKAILTFYKMNEAERKKRSENSYTKVKDQFTWEKIAEKHIQLFKTLKGLNSFETQAEIKLNKV